MSFNGSGTYTLPGAALLDGQTVSAAEHNTLRNDLATALSDCVTRDGQSPATANLPMGGFKLTGLAAGAGNGESVRYEQLTKESIVGLTTASSPQFTAVNIGHASDTTITRVSAGIIAVEGNTLLTTATGAALAGSASQAFSTSTLTATTNIITPAINGGQAGGFMNRIINGLGLYAQRAAPNLTAAFLYGQVDRHMIGIVGGTAITGTAAQNFGTIGASGYSFGAVSASWTTGNFNLQHRIEALKTLDLNNQTVTVSCKVYQDTGGVRNWKIALYKPTTTINTFSAQTLLQTSAATQSASATSTNLSATFTLGAADTDLGLAVWVFDSDAPNTVSTKNYLVTELDFRIGTIAPAVAEQVDPQINMAQCQRYARPIVTNSCVGVAYSTTGANIFSTGVPMFSVPALSTTSGFSVITPGGGNQAVTSVPAITNGTTDGTVTIAIGTAAGLVAGNGTYISVAPANALLVAEL